jgi:hypothetical protein
MVWGIVNVVKDFYYWYIRWICTQLQVNRLKQPPRVPLYNQGGGGVGDAHLFIYLTTFLMAIRKQIVGWFLYVLFQLKLTSILKAFQDCIIRLLIHYYKMCPSSLWVSLDFEWIWTFLPSEIVQPPSECGLVAVDNDLFH